MATIRGPGLFLAQYVGDRAPFDSLEGLAAWAAGLGYVGVQVPTHDRRLFDLDTAAQSQGYCDEIAGRLAERGVAVTELSTHLQGQLMAVHPAHAPLVETLLPEAPRADPERRDWAARQLMLAARASRRLGLTAHATFSGSLLWPYMYPFPPRPAGLVAEGFAELARRWRPVLDAFDAEGVDVCYELHPGEDLHDGAGFERFLDAVGQHGRANLLYDPSHFVLQQLDYLAFVERYHSRIRAFHVKDAEFRPDARTGVYGGYEEGMARAGRFRAVGDGQIDWRQVFTRLTFHGYGGWAVMEYEDPLKDGQAGAREGAARIRGFMIETWPPWPGGGSDDRERVARALGLDGAN